MSWFRKPSSTPLWRDEFSVFTADERYVNRRQFTKFLTLDELRHAGGELVDSRAIRIPSRPSVSAYDGGCGRRDCRGRREDIRLSYR